MKNTKNDIMQNDFQTQVNYDNLRVTRIFLGLIAFFESLIYIYELMIAGPDDVFAYTKLLKIVVVLLSLLFLYLFRKITCESKHFKILIRSMATILLFWALTNTFAAQSIIPDISIFILAMYGIAAIVVINKRYMMLLYTTSFIAFAIGIRYFQPNQEFVKWQIINASILSVFAWVISKKLYDNRNELFKKEKRILVQNHKIRSANQSLQNILDNTGEGFITFKSDLKVNPEHSQFCNVIFGNDIIGMEIVDLISQNNDEKQLYRKALSMCFNEVSQLKSEVYLSMLPEQFVINDLTIRANYKLIKSIHSDVFDTVLCVYRDVSYQIGLEEEMNKDKILLTQIIEIITNHTMFADLLKAFYNFIENPLPTINKENIDKSMIRFSRELHTYKGDFQQFGLFETAYRIHELEDLVNYYENYSIDDTNEICSEIKAVDWKNIIDSDTSDARSILGESFFDEGSKLVIGREQIIKLEKEIKRSLSNSVAEPLISMLREVRFVPIERTIKGMTSIITDIAHVQSKSVDHEITEHKSIKIDDTYYGEFLRSLIHIYKNAVVHGIESEDKRKAFGKSIVGSLNTVIDCDSDTVSICITDDGNGIDKELILEKVLELNIIEDSEIGAMEDEQIFDFIFLDRLSTTAETDIESGRGVGMPAVKQQIEKLGGTISIESRESKGTCFNISLPYNKDYILIGE